MVDRHLNKVKTKFVLSEVREQLEICKTDRQTNWEEMANLCRLVMENRLSTDDIKSNKIYKRAFSEYLAGRPLVLNQIVENLNLIASFLSSSDIDLRVSSFNDTTYSERLNVLDSVVNYMMDVPCKVNGNINSIIFLLPQCIKDIEYFGFSALYLPWNKYKKDMFYKENGGVDYYREDPYTFYFDPSGRSDNFTDVKYFYHIKDWDIEELKEAYPEKQKLISSVDNNTGFPIRSNLERGKTVKVVNYYFRHKSLKEVVDVAYISVTGEQKTQTYELDDVNDWIKESGNGLPEGITVSAPIHIEVIEWFLCSYIDGTDIVLEEPINLGDKHPFSFWTYQLQLSSVYPLSIASYQLDEQGANILIFNALLNLLNKAMKPDELIRSGIINNQEEFLANRSRGDYAVGEVNSDELMRAQQGMRDVIFSLTPEIPANFAITMFQMLQNSLKSISGATDALRGDVPGNVRSADQMAMTIQQSSQYLKTLIINYTYFIQQIGEIFLSYSKRYMNYAFELPGIDMSGDDVMLSANTSPENTLAYGEDYVKVQILPSYEVQEQQRQIKAAELYDRGLLPSRMLLGIYGYRNPDTIIKMRQEEQGVLEIAQAVNEHPELIGLIQKYLTSSQQANPTPKE